MRLTIIPSDSLVGVDNQFFSNLDLSACSIPANVHALQWYETEGELEFVEVGRLKPQNEVISELPAWATACVAAWDTAKALEEARIAEAKAQEEARLAEEQAKREALEAASAAALQQQEIPVTEV